MRWLLEQLCAARGGLTTRALFETCGPGATVRNVGSVLCQLRDRGWADGPTDGQWFATERALDECGPGAPAVASEAQDTSLDSDPAFDGTPALEAPPDMPDVPPLRASADALLAGGGAGNGNGRGAAPPDGQLTKQGPGAGRPAPPLTDAAACIDFAHEAAIRAMEARVHAVGDAQLTALWHGLKSVAYAAKLAIREE